MLVMLSILLLAGCVKSGSGDGGESGGPEVARGPGDRAGSYDLVRYGERLFDRLCAGCHGGGARGGRFSSLARPELAQKYPTDEALIRRIEKGDPGEGMPPCPVADLMPEHKEALAAYLRSLWRQ